MSDLQVPVRVTLQAFNPLVPADVDNRPACRRPSCAGVLTNPTDEAVEAAVCASLPNFIGMDGSLTKKDWVNNQSHLRRKRQSQPCPRSPGAIQGIFMKSEGVPADCEAWGTMALVTPSQQRASQL